MMPQNSKMLVGAVIAAALAFAVYYGLIGQQAATNIQGQANQALGTAPASQQPRPAARADSDDANTGPQRFGIAAPAASAAAVVSTVVGMLARLAEQLRPQA